MPVVITVDKRDIDGALQVAISNGSGGYRIAGPKYDGRGKTLLTHKLTPRDVKEIKAFLDQVGWDY